MATPIHCPKCGCEFELSTLVRAQLEREIRVEMHAAFERRVGDAEAAADARIQEKERELEAARAKASEATEREAELLKREREVEDRERQAALDVQRQVAEEAKRIREQEAKAAQERFGREAEERVRRKDQEVAEIRAKLGDVAAKEAELLKKQRELDERQRDVALDVQRRVAEEAKRIREQEAKAAQERFGREAEERVQRKDQELAEVRAKLGDLAAKEAALLKMERALEDSRRDAALEVQRQVAEEAKRIREQGDKRAEQRVEFEREQQRLRDEEHRQQIDGLQRTISDLQRRVQQGSQQTQGEAQEVLLRDLLEQAFAMDSVEDVPKGVHGADVLQGVRDGDGRDCGSIVWESKRTKAWSDEWLPKLRDDQRAAGAACAIIVSQCLPSHVRHFALVEGVWVCAWPYATALGAALRKALIDVASARQVAEGRGEKMQMLFDYLTGTEFRLRVEGFVEAFREMQEDLEREKRAMATLWNRRGRQMQRARDNITAFYGDLQGIAGRQLRDLPALTLEPAALPEHAGDEGEDAPLGSGAVRPCDASLKEILFGLLPQDGGTAGNASLTDRFIEQALVELNVDVAVGDYVRCRAALLAEGRIRKGRGKGGSLCRVVAGRSGPAVVPAGSTQSAAIPVGHTDGAPGETGSCGSSSSLSIRLAG